MFGLAAPRIPHNVAPPVLGPGPPWTPLGPWVSLGAPGAPAGLDSLSVSPCRRQSQEKDRKTIKISY